MKVSLKFLIFSVIVVVFPAIISAECTCDTSAEDGDTNKSEARKYKVVAIFSILFGGTVGVLMPIFGKKISVLRPGTTSFYMIKAFAAGVILATGFIHILPDAFESLTSPCLSENPWGNFPFTGFIAMLSSIGTLMIDTSATNYYQKAHLNKGTLPVVVDTDIAEKIGDHGAHVDVHTHATHGHAHGSTLAPHESDSFNQLLRHRVISQVLEMGIVAHSIIIGISLGASESPKTIRPLLVALTFHQFFEGLGLGGCITQAKFKGRAVAIMVLFFSLTTPVGIAIGFGISNVYKENSPTALIVEGVFNSASAGILIYMALVDLLATDFMSPKLQSSGRLQLGANASLLFGAGCMSLIAKWA